MGRAVAKQVPLGNLEWLEELTSAPRAKAATVTFRSLYRPLAPSPPPDAETEGTGTPEPLANDLPASDAPDRGSQSPEEDATDLTAQIKRSPRLQFEVLSGAGWGYEASHVMYLPFVAGVWLAHTHTRGGPLSPGARMLCGAVTLAGASFPFAPLSRAEAHPLHALMEAAAGLLLPNNLHVLWHTAGAVCLVRLLIASPHLQGLLGHRPLQWLGRVSFALYLTHLPVMYGFTAWAYVQLRWLDFNGLWAAGLACVASAPVLGLVAWLFCEGVDQRAIVWSGRCGRWLLGMPG